MDKNIYQDYKDRGFALPHPLTHLTAAEIAEDPFLTRYAEGIEAVRKLADLFSTPETREDFVTNLNGVLYWTLEGSNVTVSRTRNDGPVLSFEGRM